ncbi:response regulator [Desulfovibrio inopinatus]|uniref:response regulator n=1 Tax=Desulfovibrio inopinatus TaxID=102109 RepID=UPI00042385C6|nr:response regulator [Desulfovibrio inopinatus]
MAVSPNILIVDDKKENLIALETVLHSIDARIIKALSGNEALKLTLNYDFALAILDVQMPFMDGYELASLIRLGESTQDIPIIFLSAVYFDVGHQFKGYQSGAVDFITKPFNTDILLSKVRVFIDLYRRTKELAESKVELQKILFKQQQLNMQLLQEIEERKIIEAELKQSKELAEAATHAKSEFLATMSHEIRNPLNGVMGMLQLLRTTEMNAEQSNYVDISLRSSQNLLRLLSDILDISRIEAGHVELVRETFCLSDILETITQSFSSQAQEKGIVLESKCVSNIPENLVGDPLRIRQVLFNLVGNAIKFTETGHVRIEIVAPKISLPDEKIALRLVVSDTGIGIPPDKLDTIFDRFTQVDSSFTRKYSGAGLGLAIVHRLVEIMGGHITVESQLDVGTTFTVDLEVYTVLQEQPLEAAPEKSVTRPVQRNGRVLVVEDEPTNLMTTLKMLEKLGFAADGAINGKEAISQLGRGEYNCVLMDIQMPIMDGLEATRQIRSAQADYATIPIIALTAHVTSCDKPRIFDAGMNACLGKPVEIDALNNALATYFPHQGQKNASTH